MEALNEASITACENGSTLVLAATSCLRAVGHSAQLLHHFTDQTTAQAHLHALEIIRRLDLLAEPATHLGAGVAASEADGVVVRVELVHKLAAIAMQHPGIHLAG